MAYSGFGVLLISQGSLLRVKARHAFARGIRSNLHATSTTPARQLPLAPSVATLETVLTWAMEDGEAEEFNWDEQ